MLPYEKAPQQACLHSDTPDSLYVFSQAISSCHLARVLGRVTAWTAESCQVTCPAGLKLLHMHVSLSSKACIAIRIIESPAAPCR